jgi:hypothetical protein
MEKDFDKFNSLHWRNNIRGLNMKNHPNLKIPSKITAPKCHSTPHSHTKLIQPITPINKDQNKNQVNIITCMNTISMNSQLFRSTPIFNRVGVELFRIQVRSFRLILRLIWKCIIHQTFSQRKSQKKDPIARKTPCQMQCRPKDNSLVRIWRNDE